MHFTSSPNGSDATLHLLSRLSSDDTSATSYSTDSLSDYYDEVEYKRPRFHSSRKNSVARFCTSLTQRPLFWHTRRKVKGRIARCFLLMWNLSLVTFVSAMLWSIADSVLRPSYATPPAHYKELEDKLHSSRTPGRGNPRNEKVFIASNIIQHEMIRGEWGQNLLTLVDYLGPENVFVSIYENDSGPEATLALSWLREQLTCKCLSLLSSN
jgi:Cryptococcal mannosyltransferase 1